jgi:GTP-binding protein
MEYGILLNELRKYNPELLDKQRLVAISKSDLLDEELMDEMRTELDKEFGQAPYLFISSVSGFGIQQLKDKLWILLNN